MYQFKSDKELFPNLNLTRAQEGYENSIAVKQFMDAAEEAVLDVQIGMDLHEFEWDEEKNYFANTEEDEALFFAYCDNLNQIIWNTVEEKFVKNLNHTVDGLPESASVKDLIDCEGAYEELFQVNCIDVVSYCFENIDYAHGGKKPNGYMEYRDKYFLKSYLAEVFDPIYAIHHDEHLKLEQEYNEALLKRDEQIEKNKQKAKQQMAADYNAQKKNSHRDSKTFFGLCACFLFGMYFFNGFDVGGIIFGTLKFGLMAICAIGVALFGWLGVSNLFQKPKVTHISPEMPPMPPQKHKELALKAEKHLERAHFLYRYFCLWEAYELGDYEFQNSNFILIDLEEMFVEVAKKLQAYSY